MKNERLETFRVRVISVGFSVLALAIFKPFGLDAWQWEAYVHLLAIGALGVGVCMLTELILHYIVRMPRSMEQGVDYIIRRNLWFQIINTVLVSLMICLYRHYMLSSRLEGNRLSWSNFFETLLIMAFCSFAIGLYWRFKFRSRYLALELEETRLLNEQLQKLQHEEEQRAPIPLTEGESVAASQAMAYSETPSETVTLEGTTSENVSLRIPDLLYIEAVGNYVKVYHWQEGRVRTDMLRATMKQMEDDLLAYSTIVRCHRAFLVNLQQVEKIISKSGNMLLLIKSDNGSIPVSRSNMVQIRDAVKRYN
jgi:hypothetical protein